MSSSGPHRLARPAARYRPGKAPVQGDTYDDDSDESTEDASASQKQPRRQPGRPSNDLKGEEITDFKSFTNQPPGQRRTAGVVVNLGSGASGSLKPKVEEPEFDSDEYETDTGSEDEVVKGAVSGTRPMPKTKDSESEYETDSEEEEESSEEEEEVKPMFKPMFVPKSQRQGGTVSLQSSAHPAAPSDPSSSTTTTTTKTLDPQAKAESEAQARRLESQRLAGERIKLELLEKQAAESKPDLDDTDDVDPAAEFAAWRLRELARIKRQWEREILREEEEEARRSRENMTEEDKFKVDLARAEESRKKKDQERGKMGFMQKYYHKGAFFQDLDILKKRDYSTEQTEGSVDISKLPKVMQVRDYGKRSRSKYTHLADEDTTRASDPRPKGAGVAGPSASTSGCFHCGSPEHRKKDCPVLTAEKEKERQQQRSAHYQSQGTSRRHDAFSSSSTLAEARDSGWGERRDREDARARSPPSRGPSSHSSSWDGKDPTPGRGRGEHAPSSHTRDDLDRQRDWARGNSGPIPHRTTDRDRVHSGRAEPRRGDQGKGGEVKDRWTLRKEAEAAAAAAAAAAEATTKTTTGDIATSLRRSGQGGEDEDEEGEIDD